MPKIYCQEISVFFAMCHKIIWKYVCASVCERQLSKRFLLNSIWWRKKKPEKETVKYHEKHMHILRKSSTRTREAPTENKPSRAKAHSMSNMCDWWKAGRERGAGATRGYSRRNADSMSWHFNKNKFDQHFVCSLFEFTCYPLSIYLSFFSSLSFSLPFCLCRLMHLLWLHVTVKSNINMIYSMWLDSHHKLQSMDIYLQNIHA